MEMRFDEGMPFTTHIYLDVREEGVDFSVVDNMLIKPGRLPEPPPSPGGLMPACALTPDDYDRGVNIRFWKSGQISLNLALDADQALDFTGKLITALLTTHLGVAGGGACDPEIIDEIAKQITDLIREAAQASARG